MLSMEERSSLFQVDLRYNQVIHYMYEGKNPSSSKFRLLDIQKIIEGVDKTLQIEMTSNDEVFNESATVTF